MKNNQTILTPKDSDNTSISIACTAIKSGTRQTVTKTFLSKRATPLFNGDLNTVVFTLDKTKREILQYRLILEPGCIITDIKGTYRCTSIAYTAPPKHPILYAKYIGPVSTTA